MAPEPLYLRENAKPAYHIRYTWTGWPSSGEMPEVNLEPITLLWEADGLRLLETQRSPREIQLAFSTRPDVAPVFLAARVKGRLQHAIRQNGLRFEGFSRKVTVRSVGDNTSAEVDKYIAGQVEKEGFADRRFVSEMEQFTICRPEVDLRQPSESAHGRYWYNLHLVLVASARSPVTDRSWMFKIRDCCFKIAEKKGYAIACLSVMLDHLHLALRGSLDHSPEEIALSFQNNLAHSLGRIKIWSDGFYAGTFSEYDFGAIRAAVQRKSDR